MRCKDEPVYKAHTPLCLPQDSSPDVVKASPSKPLENQQFPKFELERWTLSFSLKRNSGTKPELLTVILTLRQLI